MKSVRMDIAPVWRRLANRRAWPNLDRDFPLFSETVVRLAETLEKVFGRSFDLTDREVAVFSTGRLACEDFYEIAFLAEEGLGFAAMKLLRGVFERTVVGRYIALNPDEAEAFAEYRAIDAERLDRRAAQVYGANWKPKRNQEVQKLFASVQKKYRWQPCATCGVVPQPSFSTHSLPSLARKINEVLEVIQVGEKQKAITMEDAYLLCAAIPNAHIHASMWSFIQRLKQHGADVEWNEDQGWQAEFALSSAHNMMPIVLKTQDEFFKLGLAAEIEERRREWMNVWTISKRALQKSSLAARRNDGHT